MALQLFIALGHNPQSREWFSEPVPMASVGGVSARAFVDKNINGIHDAGEEFIANAGFVINRGGRHPTLTNEQGAALLMHPQPGHYTDIALDPSTLEDPPWKAVTEGIRMLPRPGWMQSLDFPVVSTSDFDGTVFVVDGKGKRGIGDAQFELVNRAGLVVMRAKSAADGFYILSQVFPGNYTLRISAEQMNKFNLTDSGARQVTVLPDSDFISGMDMEIQSLK